MRHTELWARLQHALGDAYVDTWAQDHVIGGLGSRTVTQALDAGIPPKEVWREVWQVLDLPPSAR